MDRTWCNCDGTTADWLYQFEQNIEENAGICWHSAEVESISQSLAEQVETDEKHIDSLQARFKKEKLLYSDERKNREKEKIQHLIEQRKQYLQSTFGPGGSYFEKQQQLLKPIQRKLYNAVSEVAKQENIDFVFDRANNTALFFARGQWNLNKKVLQALHITLKK